MYNLVLYIIETFGSMEFSNKCSKILLVDHNRKSQLPYMATIVRKNHGDEQILNAQHWFEDNFTNHFSIDDVAKFVGLSPRHFKRRFKQYTSLSPSEYRDRFRYH